VADSLDLLPSLLYGVDPHAFPLHGLVRLP